MHFTPETLVSLPLETRLLRCHELSEEVFEQAVRATTDTERADLIALANSWKSLADEIEHTIRMQWRR
jgi:hypothetical protein